MTACCNNVDRQPEMSKNKQLFPHKNDQIRHLEAFQCTALSVWVRVKEIAVIYIYIFLPLNKKSYSSSRFPILDEAAPTLVPWRRWPKSGGVKCRSRPGNSGEIRLCPDSAPVLTVKASWPQTRRAGKAAEGGEESLQREYRPPGGAPRRHASRASGPEWKRSAVCSAWIREIYVHLDCPRGNAITSAC